MEQENYDEMGEVTEKAFKNLFLLNYSLKLSSRKKTKEELLFMKIMNELGESCKKNLN